MTGWDWERFGNDIRRTVQNAVDSRNYDKLNQTINDTIHQAVDGIGRGMHSVSNAADEIGRGVYNVGNNVGNNIGNAVNKGIYKMPELYGKTYGTKAGGIAMTVVGGIFCGILIISLPIFLIWELATGIFGPLFQILFGLGVVLLAAGGILVIIGSRALGKVKRFNTYIKGMEGKEYGDIKFLAEKVKKTPKFVVKDLDKMIQKGWFKQGHLDRQRTCFMVTDNAYQQYEELMKHMEAQKKQEKERKEQQEKAFDSMAPQIQEVIKTGDAYIKKIRQCNDAIPGPEISAKISRMETLIDRIFERVEQNPGCVTEIRRLMEYYLPTTVKLLEAYEELDTLPVQGENILSSKREIEKTLDTLNAAFEKLLDSLFQDTAWDVSSDISVLHTMLAQEGLMKDDF